MSQGPEEKQSMEREHSRKTYHLRGERGPSRPQDSLPAPPSLCPSASASAGLRQWPAPTRKSPSSKVDWRQRSLNELFKTALSELELEGGREEGKDNGMKLPHSQAWLWVEPQPWPATHPPRIKQRQFFLRHAAYEPNSLVNDRLLCHGEEIGVWH